MEFVKQQAATKAPADWFTGDVWFAVTYAGQEPSRMRVNLVRFSPGARTHWHSHVLGQALLTTPPSAISIGCARHTDERTVDDRPAEADRRRTPSAKAAAQPASRRGLSWAGTGFCEVGGHRQAGVGGQRERFDEQEDLSDVGWRKCLVPAQVDGRT